MRKPKVTVIFAAIPLILKSEDGRAMDFRDIGKLITLFNAEREVLYRWTIVSLLVRNAIDSGGTAKATG